MFEAVLCGAGIGVGYSIFFMSLPESDGWWSLTGAVLALVSASCLFLIQPPYFVYVP